MLLIAKKPFRGKPRKGFLSRDEFFQRIFLHKSQSWAIFKVRKKGGLRDGKEKMKRKFEDGEKSA